MIIWYMRSLLQLTHVHTIIVIEEPWKGDIELLDSKYEGKVSLYTWKALYTSGRENPNATATPPMPDDIAILMYTSGTLQTGLSSYL